MLQGIVEFPHIKNIGDDAAGSAILQTIAAVGMLKGTPRRAQRTGANRFGKSGRQFVAGEARSLHLCRFKNQLTNHIDVGLASSFGDDLAKQNVSLIPVLESGSRIPLRTITQHRLYRDFQVFACIAVAVATNSGFVPHQMTDGNRLAGFRHVRKVFRDRRVQIQLALVGQNQSRCRSV